MAVFGIGVISIIIGTFMNWGVNDPTIDPTVDGSDDGGIDADVGE